MRNAVDTILITNVRHQKWKDNIKRNSYLFTGIKIHVLIMKKLQYVCFVVGCVCAPAQPCLTLCDTLDCIVHQALLSIGFPRQEYWNWLPCPPPGDLSDPGIKPMCPALQVDSSLLSRLGSPNTPFSQFSHSVVSESLRPHGLQHARPPCPSPTPRVHSDSCPLSQWCHPTILRILCRPLLLPPSVFPRIKVFTNESVLHIRWPKYWSFSFSISPFNEYSGSISFRINWFDLLAVQGTLKSLLQHHSSKAPILQHSAFFMVQL